MVGSIERARNEVEGLMELKPCVHQAKKQKWGSVMVERERRYKNDGKTVMQRAMSLKQQKNLENMPFKGNSFAAINNDFLKKMSNDVNICIGSDTMDNTRVINNLKVTEMEKVDRFTVENPKVLLPANLDIFHVDVQSTHIVTNDEGELSTPKVS